MCQPKAYDNIYDLFKDHIKEKRFVEAEKVLIQIRNSIPINDETYIIHRGLTKTLFNLYDNLRHFDKADKIIKETTQAFPNEPHPLFNIIDNEIYTTTDLIQYIRNKKYLLKILKQFEGNVYFKISPFEFGTELICYKNEKRQPDYIIHYLDDSDSEENSNYYQIYDIVRSYRKIKVYLDY